MKTKVINGFSHVLYETVQFSEREMIDRSRLNFEFYNRRRSIRQISKKIFPRVLLDNILMTASTAPSGAHKQPWTFCVVTDSNLKCQIREAAEREEKVNYESRMTEEWLEDLKPLGTDSNKPFLEDAPYLVVVFKKAYEINKKGEKRNNYYVNESVGIACGMLISAIHHAGLVTLTHTPSPMNFLSKILNRPENERPFLLLPVGYPEEETYVPLLKRKILKDVVVDY